MTSYASECTRVYIRRGTRAHWMSPLESPNHSGGVLCSLLPKWPDEWLGTGSQNEIEHATSMPLCKVCEASANRHEWRSRHVPIPTRPAVPPSAGPAASTVPPGAAAQPGAPSFPRGGAPGASSAPAGLARGAGEAQASGDAA